VSSSPSCSRPTRIARERLDERQWRDACVDADRRVPEQAVTLFEAA